MVSVFLVGKRSGGEARSHEGVVAGRSRSLALVLDLLKDARDAENESKRHVLRKKVSAAQESSQKVAHLARDNAIVNRIRHLRNAKLQ
jgi:hypothetical protein